MRNSRVLTVVAILATMPVLAAAQQASPPPSLTLADGAARGSRSGPGTAGGSLTRGIPIKVPAYHGIEPVLSLAYSSGGGNGFVGVGWRLSGFSVIERTRRGDPRSMEVNVYVGGGPSLGLVGGTAGTARTYSWRWSDTTRFARRAANCGLLNERGCRR